MSKIALVTGASRGLGAALAEALAPTHHVIGVARTTGALEELDDRITAKGGKATLAPVDITTDAAMQQLCRSIYDRWGKVDLWVHCAIHAGPLASAQDIPEKDMARAIDVNLAATARLIRYLSPLMSTESTAVFFDDPRGGLPLWGCYGTTKQAQIALAKSWQGETQSLGPTVKILSPREMPTGTRARAFPGQDKSELAHPTEEAARLLPDILG